MKLLTFTANGAESYGIAAGGGVIDLGVRLPAYGTLRALLTAGALGEAAALAGAGADHALADVTIAKPIPFPEKTLCIGVNYVNRNEEYKDDSDLPKYPSIFMRTPGSFVAHGQPLIRPPESEQLDYEGEIAIVVGKAGRRIPQDRARDHIAGLTCLNEGTIRDWLRHGKFNVTQGKNFDCTGSVGPWMVTTDEFEGFGDLRITTRVNGEVRQDDTTASLLFPFEYLVEYVSTFTTLTPGDIISTGTPTGAGARFDPPVWLKPGDVVEVEAPGVGLLSNPVADEETSDA